MSETPSITVHATAVDAHSQATTRFLDNAGLGYSVVTDEEFHGIAHEWTSFRLGRLTEPAVIYSVRSSEHGRMLRLMRAKR